MGIRGVNIPKIQKNNKKKSQKLLCFLTKQSTLPKKNHQYFLSSHNSQFK